MRHFAAFHFGAKHFASYHLAGVLVLTSPTGPIFMAVERRASFLQVEDGGATLGFTNADTAIRLKVRDAAARLDVDNPGTWTLIVGG